MYIYIYIPTIWCNLLPLIPANHVPLPDEPVGIFQP